MNFNKKCYSILKKVQRGKVVNYGSLAKAVGVPRGARAVGNAMNQNPSAPEVPCHRVVRTDGKVGGFASGTAKKIKMLEKEGVEIKNGKIDLRKFLYEFDLK